jgi:hypothetical protein
MKKVLFLIATLSIACEDEASEANKPTGPIEVEWQPITPPRPGLECWRTWSWARDGRFLSQQVQCWPSVPAAKFSE